MKIISFLLTRVILSKRFLVELHQKPDVSVFSGHNVVDNFSVGDDLHFMVIDSHHDIYSLYNNKNVKNIEEDAVVSTYNDFQNPFIFYDDIDFSPDKAYYLQKSPGWNLDRIDQRSATLNDKYYYSLKRGENVDVYIIDTGIDITHPEFESRAVWGANFADSKNTDCNGHGTHVAGSVGSKTYGVSKRSTLVAVKVLNCEGSGTNSGVLKGMDWVISQKRKTGRPSLINMSLGGGRSDAINRAISALYKEGIVSVVAAGNENQDACESSPASAPDAITIGAVDKTNRFAGFSNYGKCVDLSAPGVDIESTYLDKCVKRLSGTSMASPHVAGYVALILGENPKMTPEAVAKMVINSSTKNAITGVKHETPNTFLYTIF